MPTITIQTQNLPQSKLRRLALRATIWCRDRHIDPTHVVISAQNLNHQIYTGGVPRTGATAIVSCRIGRHRDEEFMASLAKELTEALRDLMMADWIQLTFERQDASNTFIFDGQDLWNAEDDPNKKYIQP